MPASIRQSPIYRFPGNFKVDSKLLLTTKNTKVTKNNLLKTKKKAFCIFSSCFFVTFMIDNRLVSGCYGSIWHAYVQIFITLGVLWKVPGMISRAIEVGLVVLCLIELQS